MKKSFLLVLLCVLTFLLQAQESTNNKFTHRLGLNFGGVTGLGPSYRFWPGKFGVQFTFLPIKVSEDWQDPLRITDLYENFLGIYGDHKFISAGLSGLLTVKEKPRYRLVTYLGNHFLVNGDKQIYNVGAGFGITFDYRVGFSLLLGYAGYDITNDFASFPTLEVGVHVGLSKN